MKIKTIQQIHHLTLTKQVHDRKPQVQGLATTQQTSLTSEDPPCNVAVPSIFPFPIQSLLLFPIIIMLLSLFSFPYNNVPFVLSSQSTNLGPPWTSYSESFMILFYLHGMQVWPWSTSSRQKRNKVMSFQKDILVSEAYGRNMSRPTRTTVDAHVLL